jgi:hypothetical protein
MSVKKKNKNKTLNRCTPPVFGSINPSIKDHFLKAPGDSGASLSGCFSRSAFDGQIMAYKSANDTDRRDNA